MANIIGLTGQTGAGKSSVRDFLSRKGAAVIDADSVAHKITESNYDCICDIVNHFSCLVLNEKGTINRKALGKIVFSDKKELAALNRIIFPYILADIKEEADFYVDYGIENIVIDGATIIESGCAKFCNLIISIVADEETRLDRIIKRDGISKEDAQRRISAQKPEEFYTENSDFIIKNEGSITQLELNVSSVLEKVRSKVKTIAAED